MTTSRLAFLTTLEETIISRKTAVPGSYTSELFTAGARRIAQKVGEEAIETALASTGGDRDEVIDEAADLLYHLLVLLANRDIRLAEVVSALEARQQR